MKHDGEWAEFITAIHARLEAGEREYGDGSFRKGQSKLLGEVLEELEDVCGWSFVLWCRLRKLTTKPAGRTESNYEHWCKICEDHNDCRCAYAHSHFSMDSMDGVLPGLRPAVDEVPEPPLPRVSLDHEWIGFAPLIVAAAIALALYWCTR